MNKEKLLKEIFDSISSHKDFKNAINSVSQLIDNSNDIFKILWGKAIRSQTKGSHTYISALTLYKLNISCPLTPKLAVEQLCNDWDISIEEVPWYLANQFSKGVILELTEKLNFKSDDKNIRLKTVEYWIKKMA